MRTLQIPGFKPFPAPQAIRADGTALLCKEVLYSVSSGNQQAAICSGFAFLKEPSDGLEPSTPSLPCTSDGNRSQPTAMVFAYFCGCCRHVTCH